MSSKLSHFRSNSRQKRFLMHTRVTNTLQVDLKPRHLWFDFTAKGINKKKIKVGLVNIDARVDDNIFEESNALHSQVENVSIDFDHVDKNLKWEEIFPEWIDENGKWGENKCPNVPMPKLEYHEDLDVLVAKVPCGVRDVFRLQVNLVVANLAVESGWVTKLDCVHNKNVYVVFVGSCGPMVEIFRCDDLLMHQREYWVYKPDLRSLKQQMLMPVGSCQIASDYAITGKEMWRAYNKLPMRLKPAYVTVLHSSEAYVCGAIALAQSILQTKEKFPITTELILLADNTIGPKSITGLKAAGWKIKRINRILSPFAKKGAYNEWNYSKLRIWELTMYDKIIFINSDLLVLKNIDDLSVDPQLSAAPNENTIFNSGLIVIEPSQCMFENMMNKTFKVRSDNGGDQGFVNEIFTWWHRLPRRVNHVKTFHRGNEKHEVPDDVYTIHYLGLKPWMCYRDYDCNWDMPDHHVFASDVAHKKWW